MGARSTRIFAARVTARPATAKVQRRRVFARPPRDLRLGIYKFASVPAGQLPRDEDFVRTLRGGLHGTAMLAWGVPDAELDLSSST